MLRTERHGSSADAVLAQHPTNTADHVVGVFAFVVVAVIVVGLAFYIARWKRVRGATSRYDAMRRAFGEKGAHRIFIGSFVVAGVFLLGAIVVKATGG